MPFCLEPARVKRRTHRQISIIQTDSIHASASTVPDGELDALKHSIARLGLLSPVLVRARGNGYELVAGARRLAACRELGMTELECIVLPALNEECLLAALCENSCRRAPVPQRERQLRRDLERFHGYSPADLDALAGRAAVCAPAAAPEERVPPRRSAHGYIRDRRLIVNAARELVGGLRATGIDARLDVRTAVDGMKLEISVPSGPSWAGAGEVAVKAGGRAGATADEAGRRTADEGVRSNADRTANADAAAGNGPDSAAAQHAARSVAVRESSAGDAAAATCCGSAVRAADELKAQKEGTAARMAVPASLRRAVAAAGCADLSSDWSAAGDMTATADDSHAVAGDMPGIGDDDIAAGHAPAVMDGLRPGAIDAPAAVDTIAANGTVLDDCVRTDADAAAEDAGTALADVIGCDGRCPGNAAGAASVEQPKGAAGAGYDWRELPPERELEDYRGAVRAQLHDCAGPARRASRLKLSQIGALLADQGLQSEGTCRNSASHSDADMNFGQPATWTCIDDAENSADIYRPRRRARCDDVCDTDAVQLDKHVENGKCYRDAIPKCNGLFGNADASTPVGPIDFDNVHAAGREIRRVQTRNLSDAGMHDAQHTCEHKRTDAKETVMSGDTPIGSAFSCRERCDTTRVNDDSKATNAQIYTESREMPVELRHIADGISGMQCVLPRASCAGKAAAAHILRISDETSGHAHAIAPPAIDQLIERLLAEERAREITR